MRPAPALAADLLINGIALAAVLFAILSLWRSVHPVGRRLRRLLVGVALLLVLRIVNWAAPSLLLAIPVTMVAAWLPLLALRVAEELVRRHAPPALKWSALIGAIAFSVGALLAGAFFPAGLMAALAGFQAAMLLWIAWFLVRARALSPGERRMAATFGLVLLLAIPFAVSDFRGSLPGLPVRMGGIGILLFVLTTARLLAGTGSPRCLLGDLAGLLAGGVLVAVGGSLMIETADAADLWRIGALTAAVLAATQSVRRLRETGRAARGQLSVLGSLPALPDGADAEAMIGASPLAASGSLIERDALALYDAPTIAALAEHRVVTAATVLAPEPAQAAANLMAEHAATHLVRLGRAPPRFLALNGGQLGGSGALDVELDALSRLAAQGGA